MGTLNSEHNRICWIDVPVADLDRSIRFYSAVLNINVPKESFEDFEFGVLEHSEGNGGCLVVQPENINGDTGALVYFNVNGRIRDAVEQVTRNGGAILMEIHPIGPHGFRSMFRDSEGNRFALHSETDA